MVRADHCLLRRGCCGKQHSSRWSKAIPKIAICKGRGFRKRLKPSYILVARRVALEKGAFSSAIFVNFIALYSVDLPS